MSARGRRPRIETPASHVEARYTGEDWYAREIGAERYERCVFIDCDLTEVSTTGTVFDHCEFRGVTLNASVHETSRLDNCVFRDSSLFDATFRNCKLTGSRFVDTGMRPLTVDGGVWSWVNLFGTDLRGVNFDRVNLQEADFGDTRLDRASFRDADLNRATLRGASIRGTVFTGADLVGVQLAGLDWRTAKVDGPIAVLIAESLGAIVEP